MGNDGGSIPKRRELVKSASRNPTVSELKATALESLSHAWSTDAVTGEPLDTANVASEWRGRLFNYETILQGLVNGENAQAAPILVDDDKGVDTKDECTLTSTGIRSLKDVVRVQFKRTETGTGSTRKTIITCPISLKELGPATKSVYLVPCGHAFAEVAIRQISENACPVCSELFQRRNVVAILPTEKAELDRLASRIGKLRSEGLTHSLKKEKGTKKKDKKRKVTDMGTMVASGETREQQDLTVEQERNAEPADRRPKGINIEFAAALTARVLADQDEATKRRKLAAAR
jgi:hypothetical protein